jgi:hypothetical protein
LTINLPDVDEAPITPMRSLMPSQNSDRHYRWYEQKRVRDISSLDFLGIKETLGKSLCACRVRVKLWLLIQDGAFKNSFHWSGFQMENIGKGSMFPFPGTPFGN